jgi:enoyl-CoA hydratase/carnithine racemase
MNPPSAHIAIEKKDGLVLLRLQSADGTNRLTRACVVELTQAMRRLAADARPLIITGNSKFYSAGADLAEIAALTGSESHQFSRLGQELMDVIARFPAAVCAAVNGYCMGGGLDLALACHRRIASPHAILAHRGAALGLMTGWGGTQRLSRLIGKAKALEILITAEKIHASEALRLGLVDTLADDPVAEAKRQLRASSHI